MASYGDLQPKVISSHAPLCFRCTLVGPFSWERRGSSTLGGASWRVRAVPSTLASSSAWQQDHRTGACFSPAQGPRGRAILGSAPPKELRPQTHMGSHAGWCYIAEEHGRVRKKGDNPCELPKRRSVVWGDGEALVVKPAYIQQRLVRAWMGEPSLLWASGLKDIQNPLQLKSLKFQDYGISVLPRQSVPPPSKFPLLPG